MVLFILNQLVGMVRSLQAENRQLRQLVPANNCWTTELNGEVVAKRRQLMSMCSSARAVARVPTSDPPTATPPDTLPDVGLSEEEVRQIFRRSSNLGLFAAHLTQRVFPELFTDANQKHNFNFYGGGALNKQPLSPMTRDVIRRKFRRVPLRHKLFPENKLLP